MIDRTSYLYFLGKGQPIFISVRFICCLLGGRKMVLISLYENLTISRRGWVWMLRNQRGGLCQWVSLAPICTFALIFLFSIFMTEALQIIFPTLFSFPLWNTWNSFCFSWQGIEWNIGLDWFECNLYADLFCLLVIANTVNRLTYILNAVHLYCLRMNSCNSYWVTYKFNIISRQITHN